MKIENGDTVPDLVRRCFAAFLAGDRAALEDLFSDDFTFTSPRDDHIDKAEYFARCFPNRDQLRAHHIEQLFAQGGEALVRYLAELPDGTRFRNTEYFRIEGDKIKQVDVYFGAAAAEP